MEKVAEQQKEQKDKVSIDSLIDRLIYVETRMNEIDVLIFNGITGKYEWEVSKEQEYVLGGLKREKENIYKKLKEQHLSDNEIKIMRSIKYKAQEIIDLRLEILNCRQEIKRLQTKHKWIWLVIIIIIGCIILGR